MQYLIQLTGFTKKLVSHAKANRRGFTIIELLIATAVFSIILMVFLAAFLRVSQLFYKGVNLSNTQEAARNIVQVVTNDIQFYQSAPTINATYFCIGSHRYAYKTGVQYVPGGGNYGLLEENLSGCPPLDAPAPNPNTGHELLTPGMQLNNMSISCSGQQCSIKVRVVFYGNDPSVLYSPSNPSSPQGYQATDATCTGPDQSTQYCGTAEYDSSVLQRF